MKIKLAKTEIIHFIGIGGIGMSGLSMIMQGKGFKVQGSDLIINKNIDRLKKEKIKIFIDHKKQNPLNTVNRLYELKEQSIRDKEIKGKAIFDSKHRFIPQTMSDRPSGTLAPDKKMMTGATGYMEQGQAQIQK